LILVKTWLKLKSEQVEVLELTGRGTGRRKLSDTPEPKARPATKAKKKHIR